MSDDIIERLDDFWPDNPADRKLIADSMREIERLRDALTSIASNTCCGGCQEAARVARNALEGKP